MAISTRDRRASVIGRRLWFLRRLPVPDGTINRGDRQQVAGLYRNIPDDGAGGGGSRRRLLMGVGR